MNDDILTQLVERVNVLSRAAGLPVLSADAPTPGVTVWHGTVEGHGMSEPNVHGAVRLQYIEEVVRPALQSEVDRINAGKRDGDVSKFQIAELTFVEQALHTFPDMDAHQKATILLNTRQWARAGTTVGRVYPVAADERGGQGQRLGNEYAMTYGPTAYDAGIELERRYREALATSFPDGGWDRAHR